MQSTTANLAVIGLGAMGGRAAIALSQSYSVYGYDPAPAARAVAGAAGVRIASSAADAAASAELIFLSLPTPAVVRAVIADLGALDADTIVADLSTIDPATSRELATRLGTRGIRYLDAPVLGRPSGCGSWTLPCGGDPAAIDRLAQVAVGSIARTICRVGDSGAGATVKICNNLMFGAINTVTAEVVDLAERAGLDPALFAEVIAGSGAATVSGLFGDIAPRMAAGDYTDPTFTLRLLAKDVGLGAALADTVDRPAPVTRLVKLITDAAVDDRTADLDTAAVVESYRASATILRAAADGVDPGPRS